jgi:Skp family chaperone for outer membrane proteins
MKFSRLFLPLFSLALGCASLSAQTPAAPAATPAKVLPIGRVAWVNSNSFLDEANGIKVLVRALKELELEFSGTQSELSLLNEKLRTVAGELNKMQTAGDTTSQAFQDKRNEAIKMQQELQAKQQQAQAAVAQAQQEKQGPIATAIGKALETFSKDRDIGLLFDIAKLNESVLVAKPELDVTADFIAYFNASHP